jgi:hypothetical protein
MNGLHFPSPTFPRHGYTIRFAPTINDTYYQWHHAYCNAFQVTYLMPHFLIWDLILNERFELLGLKHNPYVDLMLDFLIFHCNSLQKIPQEGDVYFSIFLSIWWTISGSQKRLMVSIVVLIIKLDFAQEGWKSRPWINV